MFIVSKLWNCDRELLGIQGLEVTERSRDRIENRGEGEGRQREREGWIENKERENVDMSLRF